MKVLNKVIEIDRHELYRKVSHGVHKSNRTPIKEFIDMFSDETKMSMDDWTVRFREFMKFREGK